MHRNELAWTIGRMAGHSAGATDVDFDTADAAIAEATRETWALEKKHRAELLHHAENLVAAGALLLADLDQPETERSMGALRALAELWDVAVATAPLSGPVANPFLDPNDRKFITGEQYAFDFETVDPDLRKLAEAHVASVYQGDEIAVIAAIGADFTAGYRTRADESTI